MVHHSALSKFTVLSRNHAGFNSLLKAAQEAGLIKYIKPNKPTEAVSTLKSSKPIKRHHQKITSRSRGARAPAMQSESPVLSTRSRGMKRRSGTDLGDGGKAKKSRDAGRVLEKTRNTMVLRKRPRTLRARRLVKSSPAVKKVVSTKPRAVMKLAREDASEEDFSLGRLDWTPWRPAIAPSNAVQKSVSSWVPRREGPGMRNLSLFGNKTDVPAVYEFAVQPPGSRTKYPVQYKTTKGFTKCNWDTYMMSDWPTERQLDRVVRRGCKVYARRAPISRPIRCAGTPVTSLDELKSLIGQTYDYAWREHYEVDTRRYVHRNVQKEGVNISDNPDWRFV